VLKPLFNSYSILVLLFKKGGYQPPFRVFLLEVALQQTLQSLAVTSLVAQMEWSNIFAIDSDELLAFIHQGI
jgi:hypothetical protein